MNNLPDHLLVLAVHQSLLAPCRLWAPQYLQVLPFPEDPLNRQVPEHQGYPKNIIARNPLEILQRHLRNPIKEILLKYSLNSTEYPI